jgi:hypothetical protein
MTATFEMIFIAPSSLIWPADAGSLPTGTQAQ